ncbi:TRAP transporter small permease [Marasmitruncus massiliensis]|uniref:TRAP transporter small permease n=1 Tax=Marasmitruncus massiliensis TaxID=1944642 RepID=UPI000C7D85E3|nr:TRAP transporter small permease [Marasmitruncus massiliensis]MBE6904960.1 TRAP transporter small permease [Oscillospiraceae bacterium]
MKAIWNKVDRAIFTTLKMIVLLCLVLLFVILVFNVFFRFIPVLSVFSNFSMGWFDEIVELLFAWMVFSAASLLTRMNQHFRVDLIQMKLGECKWCSILELFIDVVSALFLLIFIFYSWQLTTEAVQTSPVLRLQKRWFYLCMPFNFSIMLLYTVRNLAKHLQSLTKYVYSSPN